MSQQPANMGGAMVGQMACRSCGRAIEGEYFLVANAPCCPMCTVHLRAYQDACRFSWRPWLRGLAFGFGAAVASAAAWAILAKMTGYELGLLAIGVGIFVGKAVVYGAGGRRGASYQLAAIGLSVLAIMMGKGLMVSWVLWPRLVAMHGPIGWLGRLFIFATSFVFFFQGMDFLWYAIAIWEGWRMAKLPVIPISGPHGVPAAPAMQTISFDTVQAAIPQSPQQP